MIQLQWALVDSNKKRGSEERTLLRAIKGNASHFHWLTEWGTSLLIHIEIAFLLRYQLSRLVTCPVTVIYLTCGWVKHWSKLGKSYCNFRDISPSQTILIQGSRMRRLITGKRERGSRDKEKRLDRGKRPKRKSIGISRRAKSNEWINVHCTSSILVFGLQRVLMKPHERSSEKAHHVKATRREREKVNETIGCLWRCFLSLVAPRTDYIGRDNEPESERKTWLLLRC